MALCGFFLVTTESRSRKVREAGWLYLVYSHAGTLAIAGFFAVLTQASGDFALRALAPGEIGRRLRLRRLRAGALRLRHQGGGDAAAFLAAVGARCGAEPCLGGDVRRPAQDGGLRAAARHRRAAAGSASPGARWCSPSAALTTLLAIAFALGQRDLKRLLAYSSIENIGIILLGLGLAMVGRSLGRADWVMLGMAGCLFHVWNHALFKSLLFFGAGSVVHATGSRDLERMGGLARRMPATAMLFVDRRDGDLRPAAVQRLRERAAGLSRPGAGGAGSAGTGGCPGVRSGTGAWVALAAPVLAATGALAVACFVKVVGIVFLGTPRSAAAGEAHESPRAMLAADGDAGGRLRAARSRAGPGRAGARAGDGGVGGCGRSARPRPWPSLVPFGWVSAGGLALVALGGAAVLVVLPVCRRGRERAAGAADLGLRLSRGSELAAPAVHAASSFAELITSRFAWALRPRERRPAIDRLFPAAASSTRRSTTRSSNFSCARGSSGCGRSRPASAPTSRAICSSTCSTSWRPSGPPPVQSPARWLVGNCAVDDGPIAPIAPLAPR